MVALGERIESIVAEVFCGSPSLPAPRWGVRAGMTFSAVDEVSREAWLARVFSPPVLTTSAAVLAVCRRSSPGDAPIAPSPPSFSSVIPASGVGWWSVRTASYETRGPLALPFGDPDVPVALGLDFLLFVLSIPSRCLPSAPPTAVGIPLERSVPSCGVDAVGDAAFFSRWGGTSFWCGVGCIAWSWAAAGKKGSSGRSVFLLKRPSCTTTCARSAPSFSVPPTTTDDDGSG